MNLNKISQIILITLFAFSVVFAAILIAGADGISGITDQFEVQKIDANKIDSSTLDLFLNWGAILFFTTIAVTVVFVLISFTAKLISSPQSALKSLLGIVVLGLVILVARLLADGQVLQIPGYIGADNTESWMIGAGTLLYGVYILSGLAVFSLIGTGLWKLFK